MKIKEIINFLEDIAPLYYQEDYDNSGLIIGDKDQDISNVLITIDCTESVIEEAVSRDCNLIISHHPIIFRGLKKLSEDNYVQRTVNKAIKNDISIYAMHTNLDNIYNGVSSSIAERIGLKNTHVLAPKNNMLRSLVVYCPSSHSKVLKEALFDSGAGNIGDYNKCSFTSSGIGTFLPNDGADPFVGEVGQLHMEKEDKIEVVYLIKDELNILYAMKQTHPYEEIAYQTYQLNNKYNLVGSGIVGELEEEIDSIDFLHHIKKVMKTESIRYTSLVKESIKKVAVCGGSGSSFLYNAKKVGADIYITSDFKYHEFFDADKDIIIADIGHYESEQFTKELIYDFLVKKFTKFAILLSKERTNPINYL